MLQTNKYSSKPFDFLILIFWITNIYGSTDGTGYLYNPTLLWKILTTGFPVSNGFLSVELATIILSLFILFKFKGQFRLDNFYFQLLIFLSVIYLFIIINPNNNATLPELFLGYDSRFILILPLLFISLCFLKEDAFVYVIKRIFYIGFIVILFNAYLSLFMWLIGKGRPIGVGMSGITKSTLPQSDVLFYTGLATIYFFYLFLFNKKIKHLSISLSLLLIMLLSFRRTEVIFTVFTTISIFLFYLFKVEEREKVITVLKYFICISLLFLAFNSLNVINLKKVINSQLIVFSYFDPNLSYLVRPEKQVFTSFVVASLFGN